MAMFAITISVIYLIQGWLNDLHDAWAVTGLRNDSEIGGSFSLSDPVRTLVEREGGFDT